jgi:hypothetical protein
MGLDNFYVNGADNSPHTLRGSAMEKRIGKITHYFHKIGVAVILLDDNLNTGDEIRILGTHTDFYQKVTSMQVEHITITSALKGQDIGLKVVQNVHEGDEVYRVI